MKVLTRTKPKLSCRRRRYGHVGYTHYHCVGTEIGLEKLDLLTSGNPETTNESRLSCGDVGADDIYEAAGGFEGLLCFVVRNESRVIIERHIPLSPETV